MNSICHIILPAHFGYQLVQWEAGDLATAVTFLKKGRCRNEAAFCFEAARSALHPGVEFDSSIRSASLSNDAPPCATVRPYASAHRRQYGRIQMGGQAWHQRC
jgi:hypothetical protein